MSYCTWTQVVNLTGSTLSQTIGDSLIDMAESMIDARLSEEGLGSITGSVPDLVEKACIYLTASLVAQRPGGMSDLQSFRIGDYSETSRTKVDPAVNFEKIGYSLLEKYIYSVNGDYTIFRIVGSDGERIGDYEEMTDEEEAW